MRGQGLRQGLRVVPLLALLVLSVVGFARGSAAFNASTVASFSRLVVRGSCTNVPTPFMNDVALAYTVARPDIALDQQVLLSAAAQKAQFDNETDFSVVSAVLSDAVAKANPDVLLLPLFTYALAPVYNLPAAVVSDRQLVLTRSALARIFAGNITRWDDAGIASSNPGMVMPAQNITVVYTNSASGQQWAAALALFDSRFTAAIGNVKSPAWSAVRYAAAVQVDTLVRTTATVAQTLYSISWSTFDIASAGGVPRATMINSVGNTVVAGSSSLSYATQTIAAGPNAIAVQMSASLSLTLSNSAGSEAWPMAYYAYAMVSRSTHSVEGSCASKRALVDFLYWMYTSASAARIALDHGLTMLPTLLYEQLNMGEVLSSLRCGGARVYATPSLLEGADASLITGNSGVDKLLDVHLASYARTSGTAVYNFERSDAVTAWSELDARRSHAIIVAPDLLRAQGLWRRDEAYLTLPVYLLAASPVASLPATVSTRFNGADPLLKAQYPLLPLRLDLNVLGLIFGGQVASWLDPRITVLNPFLPYWFGSDDSRLTMVVCCSDASDPQLTTSQFLNTLSTVPSFQQASGYDPTDPFPTRPFDLFPRTARPETSANWIVVPTEDQLSYVTTLRLGSFSYQLSQGVLVDPQSPIQFIHVIEPGAAAAATAPAIEPTAESMLACIEDEFGSVLKKYDVYDVRSAARARQSLADLSLTPSRTAGKTYPAGCYPFTQLLSLTLPNQYTTENVTQGRTLLHMLEWLNSGSSPSLQLSTTQRGAVHLPSALATVQRVNQAAIAGVTINGESLLYLTPADHLFDQQSLSMSLDAAGTFLSYLLAVIGAFVGFLLLEDPIFHAKTKKSTRRDLINIVSSGFVWSIAAVWPTFVLAANALSIQASKVTFDPLLVLTCWLPVWFCLTVALSFKMRSFGQLPELFANKRARADGSMITSTNHSMSPSPSPAAEKAMEEGIANGDDAQVLQTNEVHPVVVQLKRMLHACQMTDVWSLVATIAFVAGLAAVDVMGVASLNFPAKVEYDMMWVGVGIAVVAVLAWLALQLVFHLDMMQWTSSLFVGLPIFAAHHFALRSMSFTYDEDLTAAYSSDGLDGTTLTLVSILLAAACCFVLIAVQFARSKITSQGWLRQVVGLRRDKRRLNTQLQGAQQKAQVASERADQSHVLQHLVSLLRPTNNDHLAIYAWSLAQGSGNGMGNNGGQMYDTYSTKGLNVTSGFGPGGVSRVLSPPGFVADSGCSRIGGGLGLGGVGRGGGGDGGGGGGGGGVSVSGSPLGSPGGTDSPAYRGRNPVQWPRVPAGSLYREPDTSRHFDDSGMQMMTSGTGGSSTPVLTAMGTKAPSTPKPNKGPVLKAPDSDDFHRTLEWLQTSLAIPISDATSCIPLPELDDVLSHSVGIELFRATLKAQVSEENLTFYLYVRVYEDEPESSVRRELAMDIYKLFVLKGASHEVNLPSHISHDIQRSVEHQRFDRTLFAAAKQEIYNLMLTNTWSKFRASTDYRLLCAILQK